MASITVHLRGLSGSVELEVNEDATIAEVKQAADTLGIDLSGMTLRTDGQTVRDESQPVRDEQVFVTAPPEAKHGRR